MNLVVSVVVKGPIFETAAPARVHAAVKSIVQALVEFGEQRLDQMLRPRPAGVYLSVSEAAKGKASTGHYRRNVHGRVDDLHGRISDGGVVYGPWLEGISSRNVTTRFKGYSSFRRTAQDIEKAAPRTAQRIIDRLVRDMGGTGGL